MLLVRLFHPELCLLLTTDSARIYTSDTHRRNSKTVYQAADTIISQVVYNNV